MSPSDNPGSRHDILIAGAGMVGAALAAALVSRHDATRNPLRIAVLDKQLPPPFCAATAPDLRVSALNLASERLLRSWGAWPHMAEQRIHPYARLAVWEKLAQPLRMPGQRNDLNRTEFSSHEIGTQWLGHIVENLVVQRGLLSALASQPSVEVITEATVRQFESHGEEGGTLILEDGRRFSARLVVGADGALSRVRELAGLGLRQDPYHQHAFVIGVQFDGRAQDITWQAFTPHGPLAFLPLASVGERHYASLVWYDDPERIKQLMTLDDPTLLAIIREEFPDALPPLLAITGKGHFPLVKRHARDYTGAGIALIGDAAHTINPLAGQGVNLGFQDAAALAQAIDEGLSKGHRPGSRVTLGRYEGQRRLQNLMMMTLMDGFYYTFSNDIKPLKLARNIGLGLAGRLLPAKRKVLEYATGFHQAQR